jgi:very-short-patch-repair endonuclease
MSKQRPHFNDTIAQLEQLVEQERSNRQRIEIIAEELLHRDTDRANRLRSKITAILDGLELELSGRPVSSAALPDTPRLGFDFSPSKNAPADRLEAVGTKLEIEPKPSMPARRPSTPLAASDAPAPELTEPKVQIDRRTMPVTIPQIVDTADPLILTRMLDLIDYVIAVEKDKLKLVTDVAEHRALHRSHDELAELPGIAFNRISGEDAAFLTVDRLNRKPPPEPTAPLLQAWLVLSDDPARDPRLRERLTAEECQAAEIELEDKATGLDFEEYVEAEAIRVGLVAYTTGPWADWVKSEGPRRKTIALYGALFALRQALAAPDGLPQELVCGLGYAALVRNSKRLLYPLLTIPLDIELDPISHVIALVPRAEARPGVEADPLEALGLVQVDVWRKLAVRHTEELEDDALSPYIRATFETILQNAAALLDSGANYASGEDGNPLPLPVPTPELRITDGFAFFQRERRATQLMADLLAFRDLLENSESNIIIPPAIAALFTDPSLDLQHENFPTFRGINSIPGATSSDGSGEELFFPKPFNAEQVQIAQRLAVRDGVVVQGPPGTGKTHTIANIISHYLATGRRVLVTSQKSPALRVLQDQLPPQIRPLAVSLLDSDREGLRQFRGSVDLISERLQQLRKSELDAEIASLETKIDDLHRQLAANDRETEQIGRTALSNLELDGQQIKPLEAAREVLAAGEDATWLLDGIGPASKFDPCFGNEDMAALRAARQAVGDDLCYIGKTLPPADLLADVDAILDAHDSLQKAASIEQTIADGAVWRLLDTDPETIKLAETIEQQLAKWNQRRLELTSSAGELDAALSKLMAPVREALLQLRDEASTLEEDQRFFLTRPVDLPDACFDDPRFRASITDLADGGAGLGTLAGLFARATKTNIAAVRLKGKSPSAASDWGIIARYIDAADRAHSFVQSWNHACTGTGLPVISVSGPAAGREALNLLDRLDALSELESEAQHLTHAVHALLPRWPGPISRHADPSDVLDCLHIHLELARLQAARSIRKSLLQIIGRSDSLVHENIRTLMARVGEEAMPRQVLATEVARCADRISHLHGLQQHWETIQSVTAQIKASGASLWAEQLQSTPPGAIDPLCPSDWRHRWRLRRLDRWLDESNQSIRLRQLHKTREQAEADLSKTYIRAIEQRTWRALKEKASPSVMQALAAYAVAVGRIGRGTGKSANRHRKSARNAADAVKSALPCWIMPHSRVSESLPAELGIFDLVIVDEASQSTLSALPALFRAKQILVVGDDKQVSPDNVGLNMEQSNALAIRHLSTQVPLFVEPMRQESSLYDLASVIFGADRFMLREHFRCAAPIIEFSKRQFYRNELSPLRLSKASERLDPVLCDVLVVDGYRKGRGKTNPPEADYIIEELQRIADDPSFDGRTIGVTTLLGTEQAALIYSRIENDLGIPFIEKYRVRVGDPATFQGDERDIMFLSMVATPGNAAALSGLPFEQRFNVAASRARERMILVRSIELDQLSPSDKLRRALLEHFRSPFPNDTEEAADARLRCESDFEREVFDALHDRGYALDTQVRVGQHRIDIVVEGDDDRRLAIECDGDRYHGPEQWPADMQRQRTLERAGWRFWRCFASRFVRERQSVLEELCALLDSLDIKPRTADKRSTVYTEFREWRSGGTEEGPVETRSDNLTEADAVAEVELSQPTIQTQFIDTVLAVGTNTSPETEKLRTTEAQIQEAILQLMSDGQTWTNAELKRGIPEILELSAGDRQRSPSRPREEKWEELVNNALTRTGRSNSLYARGLVVNVGIGQHRRVDS